jgi:hypothetical protein
VTNDEVRIKRLYALAERLGRLSGEAHNLVEELTAKIVAGRDATRSTTPPKAHRPAYSKKS